jgi:hypothetical protein
MLFRFMRLFFLRFLPRRLFTVISFVELALLARRVYRAASASEVPPRLVGRSGFDDELGDGTKTPPPSGTKAP